MIQAFFGLDTYLAHLLLVLRFEPVTSFFLAVTLLGYFQVILIATAVLTIALYSRKMQSDALGLVIAVLGSGAFVLFLKYLVQRPRPDVFLQVPPVMYDPSFPSAHAALSMAFYGYIAYILLQVAPSRLRTAILAVLPILIALIASSRVFLGVHYLSDVVAGLLIGLFFVWFGIQYRLFALLRYERRTDRAA